MTLLVYVPEDFSPERSYALSVVLGDFLGLNYSVFPQDRNDVLITSADGGELFVADGLFAQGEKSWLKPESLPRKPLKIWTLPNELAEAWGIDSAMPILYGESPDNENFWDVSESTIRLGLDIFGSVFLMLSRYEETVQPDLDWHGRFPASSSLAYQEGFLDRPIVNEYVEILWRCLKTLWPGIIRKQREFSTVPTHDVDVPYAYAFNSPARMVRSLCGDVLKRHAPIQAARNFLRRLQVKAGNLQIDPYNHFEWIMDLGDLYGVRSAFYFICDHSGGAIDGDYSIDHPLVRRLIRRIHERGHEIGLHPSYNTYQDLEQTKKEFEILKSICEKEGIHQDKWGGRQHYLRWETPGTFTNWDRAGLDYDSTLGFADHVGFRCGTCYEYPVYDLKDRKRLKLVEIPLIAMDCALIDSRYMNLGVGEAALRVLLDLKEKCRRFNGKFVLLWHNSRFFDSAERALFEEILGA